MRLKKRIDRVTGCPVSFEDSFDTFLSDVRYPFLHAGEAAHFQRRVFPIMAFSVLHVSCRGKQCPASKTLALYKTSFRRKDINCSFGYLISNERDEQTKQVKTSKPLFRFSWISVLSVNLTGAKRGTRVHFDTITISLFKDPLFSSRVEWGGFIDR